MIISLAKRIQKMTDYQWSGDLKPVQIRIARQTNQLEALKRFYCEGLGLPVLTEFHDHAGYDGVMIGIPGADYHLEFVQHVDGSPGEAPSKENLLVFYIPDEEAIRRLTEKLVSMGYAQVASENPYWDANHAITIEDPDKWRIVLQPGSGISGKK